MTNSLAPEPHEGAQFIFKVIQNKSLKRVIHVFENFKTVTAGKNRSHLFPVPFDLSHYFLSPDVLATHWTLTQP